MSSRRISVAEPRQQDHSPDSRPPLGGRVELRFGFHLPADVPDPSVAQDRYPGWYNADHSADVKLVRFEDLLSDPETVARQLCEFLKVNFHENMTDPSSYTDGAGQPWRQNTSYRKNAERDGERRFNRTALDKWKQVLTDEVLTLIDLFCSREMALLGYQPASDIEVISRRLDILDYEDDLTTCAEWIKPYATYNNIKEIPAELCARLTESQRELRNSPSGC